MKLALDTSVLLTVFKGARRRGLDGGLDQRVWFTVNHRQFRYSVKPA